MTGLLLRQFIQRLADLRLQRGPIYAKASGQRQQVRDL